MAAFPSKSVAIISSASIVNQAANLCLGLDVHGLFVQGGEKPEVDLRVYTKDGDVAGGFSSC